MATSPEKSEKRVTPRPIREEQANAEVGKTQMASGVAIVLFLIFVVLLLSVPVTQLLVPRSFFNGLLGKNETEAELSGPTIKATVAAVSEPPDPNGVYNDFIMKLHLTDIEGGEIPKGPKEVVLGVMAMEDRVIQPIASVKAGAKVEAAIRPWNEVSAKVGGINSSSLDDERFLTLDQLWADGVPVEAIRPN